MPGRRGAREPRIFHNFKNQMAAREEQCVSCGIAFDFDLALNSAVPPKLETARAPSLSGIVGSLVTSSCQQACTARQESICSS